MVPYPSMVRSPTLSANWPAGIPAVAAAAKKEDEGMIAGRHFIAKPVTVEEVIDCIEKNL